MNLPAILDEREQLLVAELGAIAALRVAVSKDSSVTVRQCSKLLDDTSVQLRKDLIAFDKTLAVSND